MKRLFFKKKRKKTFFDKTKDVFSVIGKTLVYVVISTLCFPLYITGILLWYTGKIIMILSQVFMFNFKNVKRNISNWNFTKPIKI